MCSLADLPLRAGVQVLIEGRAPLALWRLDDRRVCATDDTCTHGKASLVNDGFLDGHIVECGMHQGCFDVRDGSVLALPCRVALRTYEVQIRDDDVYVVLGAGSA